jgi:hypothetical protein
LDRAERLSGSTVAAFDSVADYRDCKIVRAITAGFVVISFGDSFLYGKVLEWPLEQDGLMPTDTLD